jgi:biopolymer transport protein ExbD
VAFGGFEQEQDAPLAEINMIPLIDVMLVLLVIFIITAPVMTHAVKVDLPEASSEVNVELPETITIAVDARGQWYWNDTPIGEAELPQHLSALAADAPDTTVQLHADQHTPYATLARIMSAAQRHGITRLGFVTAPEQ